MLLVYSFKHNEALIISSLVNSDLQSISDWSASNDVHLNPSKSFYMIVGSFLSRMFVLNIHLNSMPITSPSSIRILGLHVEPSWSFDCHVTVKCRAAYARLRNYIHCVMFFPSPKNSLSFNYLSSLYLITLTLVYIPALNKRLFYRILVCVLSAVCEGLVT